MLRLRWQARTRSTRPPACRAGDGAACLEGRSGFTSSASDLAPVPDYDGSLRRHSGRGGCGAWRDRCVRLQDGGHAATDGTRVDAPRESAPVVSACEASGRRQLKSTAYATTSMNFFSALRAPKLGAVATVEESGVSARIKFAEWVRRYGLAECAGVTCALLGSFVVRRLTGNAVAAAYGGAWGETLGYSSVIVGRDFFVGVRAARSSGRRFGVRTAGGVATDLLSEFGPAGALDTFVTRPLAMGFGVRLLGPVRGLVAGKLVADVLFYVPVIFMYERRNRRRRW